MSLLKNIAPFVLAFGILSCNNAKEKTAEDISTATKTETVTSTDSNTAKQLPLFKLIHHSGKEVDLTGFQGKKIFLNLWASWCPPCRREMPSIQKLFNSVDTSKVAFIMLALDDDFEKSKKYFSSQKLDMPLYYPGEAPPAMFNVPGIPTTFIFNEQGQLIDKIEGGDDYDRDKYRKMLK
jgi:thiol-disulfide isomerase/thioredoxin